MAWVVVLVALLLAAGCSQAPEVPLGPDGEPDPVLLEGRDLFSAQCQRCHSADGGGGRGPNIRSDRVLEKYPVIEDQMRIVSEGKNAMPAFAGQLTDAEIEAVVRYTREVLG